MRNLKRILKAELITAAVVIPSMAIFAILKSYGYEWWFYAAGILILAVVKKIFK